MNFLDKPWLYNYMKNIRACEGTAAAMLLIEKLEVKIRLHERKPYVESLGLLVNAVENNTGHEPSVSLVDRECYRAFELLCADEVDRKTNF